MSTRPSTFRVNDVKRAFAAARLAGIKNPKVEIVRPDGSAIRISEQPETPPAAAGDQAHQNPWDEVLTDDAHEKRPA